MTFPALCIVGLTLSSASQATLPFPKMFLFVARINVTDFPPEVHIGDKLSTLSSATLSACVHVKCLPVHFSNDQNHMRSNKTTYLNSAREFVGFDSLN